MDGIIKLEHEWQDFLERETYLTQDVKKEFLNEMKQLPKYPWYYWLIKPAQMKHQRLFFKSFKTTIEKFNDHFIERRFIEYKSFFDGTDDGLKYPLDWDQRLAIIKDDKYNLVIAGAGSGKTSVLTSRIAYLVRRKDKVAPDRILALAFTRVAAKEMEERLKLGYKIIQDETAKKPQLLFGGNETEQYKLIKRLFQGALKEPEYQVRFLDYLAYHVEKEVEEDSFEDKETYFRYMRNKRYTTLNNIEVKSISERTIANFFFRHGIEFQYEPLIEWVDKDDEDKEYTPDFYLPEYDIYIEHWGMNENFDVPEWFTITSEEYRAIRRWKLEQFRKHQKNLIETWEYERFKDELIPNLKAMLKQLIPDIKFVPIPYEELIQKTHGFKDTRNQIVNLISSFIKIAKTNYLKVKEIEKRVKSRKYTTKQRLFGRLALEIFKQYQHYLKNEGKIDFNDMINQAVDLVKANPEKYLNKHDHVLIDEFQDISYQRLELIRGFVKPPSKTKLFCVGDDWQSIYQFAGSDVRFFTNFADYFPNPEITNLRKNYRCSQSIVEMSNDLISRNKNQIRKEVRATGNVGQRPLLFELPDKFLYSHKERVEQAYNLIKILLSQGVTPDKIMVLARFNNSVNKLKILCGANGIPTEVKAGGMRFYSAHSAKGAESEHVILLDLTSGLYGFPSEIQDPSVLELAQRFETKSRFEEERRLFYVALTRSKKFLYLYTIDQKESAFLEEIKDHLTKIHADSSMWADVIPKIASDYVKERVSDVPSVCPECGKRLRVRKGKYGRFLGCAGYPTCRFTLELEEEKPNYIACPQCSRKLVVRSGRYGPFLGCIGYPECRFAYNLTRQNRLDIYCPECGRSLRIQKGQRGSFLGCSGYPACKFTFNYKN